MEVVAREVTVRGRVQGVFFRDTCRQQAERLGVTGWVRNELDGTVRGHFEGEPDAVERLVDWCRQGPRQADVEAVDVSVTEPAGHSGFEAR